MYNFFGTVTADAFNLFGHSGDDGVSGFNPGATDVVPGGPLSTILNSTLTDNGGPTLTLALVGDSPAINTAGPSCPPPATDQRGEFRPQGTSCDIGAFEVSMAGTPICGNGVIETGEQCEPPGGVYRSVPVRFHKYGLSAASR